MDFLAAWTRASCIVVCAGIVFVAVSAEGNRPNTGIADPIAPGGRIRPVAAGSPANIPTLPLSSLRGIAGSADTSVHAQPANRPPTLEVVIENRAPGAAREIGTARARAGFIFGEASIRIAWVLQGDAGHVALDADERIHLVVIDASAGGLLAGNPSRLGFAMAAANRAYVHYDRVHKLARAHHVQPGWFLGVVIAHELAHLLFQDGGHAENGLMASALSPSPTAPAVFTRQEAQRLRDRLRGEMTLAQR